MAIIQQIIKFYSDGFRSMDIGKKLWVLILIKLFLIFVILRIFFFTPTLSKFNTTEEKSDYIRKQLIKNQ